MNTEEIRKFQCTQISLIDEIEDVCKTLGLSYYLIGGSLLGAIRHKGFIPWDADIDIAMRRKDYDKFVDYYINHNDSRFFLQHYRSEKFNCSPHAILRMKNTKIEYFSDPKFSKLSCNGIYLDIFPLDKAPKNKIQQKKQEIIIKIIKKLLVIKSGTVYSYNSRLVGVSKILLRYLIFPLSLYQLCKLLDKYMKKYENYESEYLVSMASHYSYSKQLMNEGIYGIPVKVEFEDSYRSAPAKYDLYLKQLYGDYMQIPTNDDRYRVLEDIKCIQYNDGSYYKKSS